MSSANLQTSLRPCLVVGFSPRSSCAFVPTLALKNVSPSIKKLGRALHLTTRASLHYSVTQNRYGVDANTPNKAFLSSQSALCCPRLSPRPVPKRAYASRRFTRQERIDEAKFNSQSNLNKLDNLYDLFNKDVTKVVDLGSAPGIWLTYARNRLSQIHRLKQEKLQEKCTIIGMDLLFFMPPTGTFFTQGNIYSQNVHTQVESLLQEAALRHAKSRQNKGHNVDSSLDLDADLSYISKELNEIQLESSTEKMADEMKRLDLNKQRLSTQKNPASKTQPEIQLLPPFSYQADLVLSDLGTPPLQESGFHNNTLSKPYIRSSQNKMLRQPWDNPEKASIDMAEAALLLCGTCLAKGGNFVVRLAQVDLSDPELSLIETRFSQVFHKVTRWSANDRISSLTPARQDLFIICEKKKDHTIDKYEVFGVKRPSNLQ